MKPEEFRKELELYYGAKYQPALKGALIERFARGKSSEFLKTALVVICNAITSQYKTPPDIALINPLVPQIEAAYLERLGEISRLERMAQKALPDLGGVEPELALEFLTRLREDLAHGSRRDPRADPQLQTILRKALRSAESAEQGGTRNYQNGRG